MAFNPAIIGKHFSGDKIKFTGRNTQCNVVWKCSGDTYKEIYDWLVDHEVITRWDEDPVDRYLLNKLGKTWDDYTSEDDEIDFNQLYIDGDYILQNDNIYKEIITNEDGNAYYQEWEEE